MLGCVTAESSDGRILCVCPPTSPYRKAPPLGNIYNLRHMAVVAGREGGIRCHG